MNKLVDRDEILDHNEVTRDCIAENSRYSKTDEYIEYMQFLDNTKDLWGEPIPYNPWIYSSGIVNAKVYSIVCNLRPKLI